MPGLQNWSSVRLKGRVRLVTSSAPDGCCQGRRNPQIAGQREPVSARRLAAWVEAGEASLVIAVCVKFGLNFLIQPGGCSGNWSEETESPEWQFGFEPACVAVFLNSAGNSIGFRLFIVCSTCLRWIGSVQGKARAGFGQFDIQLSLMSFSRPKRTILLDRNGNRGTCFRIQ